MSNNLFRLLSSVVNEPHLVTETALRPIVDYLQARSVSGIVPQMLEGAKSADQAKEPLTVLGTIGEIQIDGVLTYKPVMTFCGPAGVSYQGVLEDAQALIDSGVDTLLMTFSSPGGQAAHCFTTALDLRHMCDEAGVKLISYIDLQACSAALALSVVADEVYIHPSAVTGSIGCVCALIDDSKYMEMNGLKPVYIASTPGKTGMNSDGSFSEEFLAELQERVTQLGNEFADHVAEFTGIKVEDIKAMDAKVYTAKEAVDVGLANAVMDHRQFAEYMAKPKGKSNA